jgi:nucleoside-diphosphate-sugar epimerase
MTGSALVTGATGFIGGRVSSALVEAGWTVRCLVIGYTTATPTPKGS